MTATAFRELVAWARLDERERVALDLHDGVAPLMEGARMHVEALVAAGPAADPEDLRRVLRLLEECGAELRRTVHELCPPDLEELGLAGAIERHVARLGLDCRVTVTGTPRRLSAWRELAAFRLAQEALANAGRHARGSAVELGIDFEPAGVSLTVVDAGPGPGPGPPAVGRLAGDGLGRRSMRRNARRTQGGLALESAPGGGTVVALRVPA